MNLFQKIAAAISPFYKHKLRRKEEGSIFHAIISSLPSEYNELKKQAEACYFWSFRDWILFPDFKFITTSFGGEEIFKWKKNQINYKLSGIQIYSTAANKFTTVEIIVINNLISGLRIENCTYHASELDLSKINTSNISRQIINVPKGDVDKFIDTLDENTKELIDLDSVFDIDFGNRTYFAFYDLEDGNYLAADKNHNVYSLVHDARPASKKLNLSIIQILSGIAAGTFDKEQHLNERYKS